MLLVSLSSFSQHDTIYPPDTLLTPALVSQFNTANILSTWTLGFCPINTSGSDTTFAPCYYVTYEDHYNTSIALCPDNLDEVGGYGMHLGVPVLLDSNTFYQMEIDGSNIINDTNNYWINYKNLTQGLEIDGGGPGHDYCIEADLYNGTNDTWYQSFQVLLGPIDLPGNTPINYSTAGKIGILKDGVLLEHTPPSSETMTALYGGIIPVDWCGWHPEPAGFGHFHMTPTGINYPIETSGGDSTLYGCVDVPQEANIGLAGFTFEGIPIYGPLDSDFSLPTDLDECLGHTGMTPDYPNPVYHYHTSSTDIVNNPPCRFNRKSLEEFEYGEWTGTVSAPSQPGSITGLASVCENQTGLVYSISDVTGATSYNWTVPSGATIVSGAGTTSITVNFGTASGNICVNAQNSAGTSTDECLAITTTSCGSAPATPGSISGLTSVCENQSGVTYTIADVTGADTYNWTVPTGATITSGVGTTTIIVDFGTTSGDVCVNAENTFGNSADQCETITVSVCGTAPSTPGAISGLTSVCENQPNVSYSISAVTGADSYNWTVPTGATITSGTGTTTITVNWGTTSGDVCVNAQNTFGTSTDQCETITVNTCTTPPMPPGAITGLTSVCENQSSVTYSIADVTGADTYNWNVPSGATIVSGNGTTSIVVDWGTTSGNICVDAQNTAGTSPPSCEAVTVTVCGTIPGQPGDIAGLDSVCENQSTVTYSVDAVSGADTYNWTVPTGASIVSGDGTTSIVVDFGTTSGDVCVNAENTVGITADTCFFVEVVVCGSIPGNAPPIMGLDTVCANQSGVSYMIPAVTGATNYIWTVPTGATIVSGAGTNSITVDFGNTFGDVCVTPENNIGTSNTQCKTISECDDIGFDLIENPALLNVYPNPIENGEMNIQGDYDHFALHTIDGALVIESLKANTDIITKVDVSALPKGIYFLTAEKGNQMFFKKVVIK